MLYSVFVGHLEKAVKKEELYPLFQGCGDVEDIFVCDDSTRSSFNYAFVRYSTADAALKAVSELDKWQVRGTKIIVDIAKDTADRIKEERKNNNDRMVKSTSPKSVTRPLIRCEEGKGSGALVQDIMYLSRIKETCAGLNYQVNSGTLGGPKTKTVDVDKLLNKVAAAPFVRIKPVNGKFDQDTSPEMLKQKLIESESKTVNISNSRAYQYVTALKTVMETMNSFLQDVKLEPDVSPNKDKTSNQHEQQTETAVDRTEEIKTNDEQFSAHGFNNEVLESEIYLDSIEQDNFEESQILDIGSQNSEIQNISQKELMKMLSFKPSNNPFVSPIRQSEDQKILPVDNLFPKKPAQSLSVNESLEEEVEESDMFVSHAETNKGPCSSISQEGDIPEFAFQDSKPLECLDVGQKDIFRQFSFNSPTIAKEQLEDNHISVNDLFSTKPQPSLKRNASDEGMDTSNSDSGVEDFSRDSGIESDAMSARTCKKNVKQPSTEKSNLDCMELADQEEIKPDDRAIIENFLLKALHIEQSDVQPRNKGHTQSVIPSKVSGGKGRGILGLIKK